MNTANLQLEGILLVLASLLEAMRRRGLLSEQEIDAILDEAEASAARDIAKGLSGANLDAIRFPMRFLKAARQIGDGDDISFSGLAAAVGETKPQH